MNQELRIQNEAMKRAGYTLAELMVALFVFIVAVSLAVGAFINALRTQRLTTQLMALNSNASLIIEQLTREIRTGYDFKISQTLATCSDYGQADTLEFFNSSRGNKILYRFDAVSQSFSRMECAGANCAEKTYEALSDARMLVRRACFELSNETKVPRVTFFFRVGSINQDLQDKEVAVQTTVSARIIPSLDL